MWHSFWERKNGNTPPLQGRQLDDEDEDEDEDDDNNDDDDDSDVSTTCPKSCLCPFPDLAACASGADEVVAEHTWSMGLGLAKLGKFHGSTSRNINFRESLCFLGLQKGHQVNVNPQLKAQ